MLVGFRNVIWNIRLKGWDYVKKYAGIVAATGIVVGGASWGIQRTRQALGTVVAAKALDRERSGAPEYLYFSDPAHEQRLRDHINKEGWSIWPYVGRWMRRWRRATWRRLLHVCHDGSESDRFRVANYLASLHHLKEWEWIWLSQRLEGRTAVMLARGKEAKELLYVPPLPITTRIMSPTVSLSALAKARPKHTCLAAFLQEHMDRQEDVQRLMEQESSGDVGETDVTAEEMLLASLKAVIHHLDMTPDSPEEQSAAEIFALAGGLALIQRAANSSEKDLQLISARLLLRIAPYHHLIPLLHRAGLIKILSQWLNGKDPELCCLAAGTLAGLEKTLNKEYYGPAVALLHPTHRPAISPKLDVVTVHGLLGEPFVTWRQRDRDENEVTTVIIPEYIEDSLQNDDDFEVILRDLPESSLRDDDHTRLYRRSSRDLCVSERDELLERSKCWPRDWLPKDCPNIRVLGVSYSTVMTEWGVSCGFEETGVGLEARARWLSAALRKAGVGIRPTVFVAHSMGGLLVKQILVNETMTPSFLFLQYISVTTVSSTREIVSNSSSVHNLIYNWKKSLESNDESEKALARNTWGVIFYSTPHHGTRAAHALWWPSREVQDLREDCAVLGRLHKRWLLGYWRCVCVGEAKATALLSLGGLNPAMHLVPPASADAGRGPFYTLPLNHLDICKPATRHSFIYRIVVEMVQHAKGEKCSPEGCQECNDREKKESEAKEWGPTIGNFIQPLARFIPFIKPQAEQSAISQEQSQT